MRHRMLPKIKSLFNVPVSVAGMQPTTTKRSATLKFSSSTLVTVRIERMRVKVMITATLPKTEMLKMSAYEMIITSTGKSSSGEDLRVLL